MNDTANYITAKQAAALLKVSERQVHHYGVSGKIATVRAGRRLLYNPDDVESLAQQLRVDIKPMVIRKDDVSAQMARYIVERKEYDETMMQTQRDMQETQAEMRDELAQIRATLSEPAKPRGPNWQVVAVLALVLAIVLVVLIIALRLF